MLKIFFYINCYQVLLSEIIRDLNVIIIWQRCSPLQHSLFNLLPVLAFWAWSTTAVISSLNILQLKCKMFMRVPWTIRETCLKLTYDVKNAVTLNMFRGNMSLETCLLWLLFRLKVGFHLRNLSEILRSVKEG